MFLRFKPLISVTTFDHKSQRACLLEPAAALITPSASTMRVPSPVNYHGPLHMRASPIGSMLMSFLSPVPSCVLSSWL